jgi:adenylate cyclase
LYRVEKSNQSLSILCAAVTGRARLPRYIDRPDALYAIDRCERRIRRSIETHGGELVNHAGGKVMAFFANSVDALQSAIELQQRVADLPLYAGAPLAVHVGICTGHQSSEKHYFASKSANPAANLADIADPEHILLSVPKRMKFFPWSQLTAEGAPLLAINCGKRQLGVIRVAWQESDPVTLKEALAQLETVADQLFLRHNDTEIVLDASKPVIKIGRQADCEIVLTSTSSSRVHGTIERRLERFFYVDRSANGTFVTLDDQSEFFIRHKELLLYGQGQLSLGAPSSSKDAELVRFQTESFS